MKNKKILFLALIPILLISSIPLFAYAVNKQEINQNNQYQYWLSFDSNGGSNCDDTLYVNGDKIQLPTPKKYGYSFGGWYLDNQTFESPFFPGSTIITKNTKLYAKWVVKQVIVYLDTANENEFTPLVYNVGDCFHISSLPKNVLDKKYNGLSFPFLKWVNGTEEEVLEDFILNDTYYEFHSTYGLPVINNFDCEYQTNFDENYGYIDKNHSWIRGETNLPATGIGQSDPLQTVCIDSGELVMSQMRHKNRGYGAKVCLPSEYTSNLKEYTISTTFRITDLLIPNPTEVNAYDVGFGIMVGFDLQTGANVEAVVDAYTKKIRIGAANANYSKSTWDSTTQKFAYSLPSSVNLQEYHTLKVRYSGLFPSSSNNLSATNIYVYFDDIECWNTKDVLLNKNWFYEGQATGDYIGFSASMVEARIKEVNLQTYDEKSTIYNADFSNNYFDTFADGWKYVTNAPGSNVGSFLITDGKLFLNSYFKNQSCLKNQVIYTPVNQLKNCIIQFQFQFIDTYAKDKYFALTFRGNQNNAYNALVFRSGNGQIQLYKHGVNSSLFSDWGNATTLKTISNGFGKNTHDILFIIKDNYLLLYIDGVEMYSNIVASSLLFDCYGAIGLLASSSNVSFDNLKIYNIDKGGV